MMSIMKRQETSFDELLSMLGISYFLVFIPIILKIHIIISMWLLKTRTCRDCLIFNPTLALLHCATSSFQRETRGWGLMMLSIFPYKFFTLMVFFIFPTLPPAVLFFFLRKMKCRLRIFWLWWNCAVLNQRNLLIIIQEGKLFLLSFVASIEALELLLR